MTAGIHHITAIASDAQKTYDFYAQILGLRLVKKTVNQDDTFTYHLFFGDKLGHPGMDLTFFIFRPAFFGRRRNGLVTKISLEVPESSLAFWQKRFVKGKEKVKNDGISERFGKKRLVFFDEDDQQLEFVGVPLRESADSKDVWETKEISRRHAIRSFYSATLSVSSRASIEPILTGVFGYELVSSDGHIHLYHLSGSRHSQTWKGSQTSSRANFIEVSEDPSLAFGRSAAGAVHHIAFRAAEEDQQLAMREKVRKLGLLPTVVIDRFYFRSVYFRTPAGILFEIATDGPGFTADETQSSLGKKLALPPFLEQQRVIIERHLPPLVTA